MNALTVAVIGLVACWIGFFIGVVFVCVVESARERHAPWLSPRDREVSL